MNKIILIIPVLLLSGVSFADQLAYITKEQAESTVAYFNGNETEEVVL